MGGSASAETGGGLRMPLRYDSPSVISLCGLRALLTERSLGSGAAAGRGALYAVRERRPALYVGRGRPGPGRARGTGAAGRQKKKAGARARGAKPPARHFTQRSPRQRAALAGSGRLGDRSGADRAPDVQRPRGQRPARADRGRRRLDPPHHPGFSAPLGPAASAPQPPAAAAGAKSQPCLSGIGISTAAGSGAQLSTR